MIQRGVCISSHWALFAIMIIQVILMALDMEERNLGVEFCQYLFMFIPQVIVLASIPNDSQVITTILSIPNLADPDWILIFCSNSHSHNDPTSVPLCSGRSELTVKGSPHVGPPPVIANVSLSSGGLKEFDFHKHVTQDHPRLH